MKVLRFIALKNTDVGFLAKLVDRHIQAGWQPQGGVIVTKRHSAIYGRYEEEYVQIVKAMRSALCVLAFRASEGVVHSRCYGSAASSHLSRPLQQSHLLPVDKRESETGPHFMGLNR